MPAPARAIDLVQGAGVGKPPMKEPAGKRRAVGRLWGFGVAAALAGGGLPRIAGLRQALRIVVRGLPHLTAYLGIRPWRRSGAFRGRAERAVPPGTGCSGE